MIANRLSWGTTSRKSSIRLPARLTAWSDSPVTLPPGLARLATKPLATGSIATAKTMGMTDVACGDSATDGDNYVDLHPHELGGNFGVTLGAALRPTILDRDVTVLDPAQFA